MTLSTLARARRNEIVVPLRRGGRSGGGRWYHRGHRSDGASGTYVTRRGTGTSSAGVWSDPPPPRRPDLLVHRGPSAIQTGRVELAVCKTGRRRRLQLETISAQRKSIVILAGARNGSAPPLQSFDSRHALPEISVIVHGPRDGLAEARNANARFGQTTAARGDAGSVGDRRAHDNRSVCTQDRSS